MRNPLHHPRLALARPGLLCLSLLCGSIANSQIAAWEFNAALGNEATIAATTLNANLNAATYRFLVLIREFDLRRAWGDWGMCLMAHWLAVRHRHRRCT